MNLKHFTRFHSTYKELKLIQLKSVENAYPIFQKQDMISKDDLTITDNPSEIVHFAGRIRGRRYAGKKLLFLDVEHKNKTIQVVLNHKYYKDLTHFKYLHECIGLGDIYQFTGFISKTKAGQNSLFGTVAKLLAPCLHPIPEELKDDNTKHRLPFLNMLVNPEIANNLRTRSKVTSYLRRFLEEQGFIEIETPILSSLAGGANAKPFETHMSALDLKLQLRIAPELYLKQLVVGGFDKVFEIGKQFRNEGIDLTHNPEFTTCELYQTYTTLDEMMSFTESLLRGIVVHTTGKQSLNIPSPLNASENIDLDFSKPFQKIHIVKELENILDTKFPDLNDTDSIPRLLEICKERHIEINPPVTLSRIMDQLISIFIEPRCIQPTFLVGHPVVMSPLAKGGNETGLTDRFELIIATKELINAYSELNDPEEQRKRFISQQQDKLAGDEEAQSLDSTFVTALEYGLPPTVGWGLGIDRLCMLLSGTRKIREVIAFPVIRPENKS
ncbi:hypothetical protein BC833DRAFT_581035 [Globomyces pollinis-pini]|nr:hypothetical protein BC833DRAFT_581035 [Globomyces pollinis-pini]